MASNGTTRIYAGAGHWVSGPGRRCRGGLYRRSPGDGEWQALTTGLPENVEARALLAHPREPGVLYAGTQDGPYRTTDGGAHWERLGFPDRGAVVWSLAFHPARPRVMYAGVAPVGIYRSEDGGETWIDLSAPLIKLAEAPHLKSRIGSDIDAEGMLDSHAFAVSAAAPGSAFLAVRMGVFRTDDRGATWNDVGIGRFSPLTYCRDVIVSPHDPRVLYACLSVSSRGDDGSLYRSDDVGRQWRRFDHGVKVRATMMAVAVHPRDPARVYCVSRCGQVFGTEDAGASWREYPLPEGVEDTYTVACA